MSLPIERYLAVDLHKHYLVVGGVNAHQEVVLPPRRVELRHWPVWAKANLRPNDSLVVEATTNTWEFYDQSVSFVERLLVADPRKVAWIAQTRVKTNPLDVMKLARLSAAHLIPEVWVPPREVRELRAFLTHRRQLVKTQTTLKNRLHSLLHGHHLVPPGGDPFLPSQRAWWEGLSLSPTQQLHVRHDLATLDQLAAQLAEVDAELYRLSCVAPWSDDVLYLLQLPGIGLLTAMTLLAAIGDVTRFPSAKKLVGYSGLGAGVYDTGQTHRGGHITKEGRRELRSVLVEAAWRTVECSDFWRAEFERLCRRMHQNKATPALHQAQRRCMCRGHRAQVAGGDLARVDGARDGPPSEARPGGFQTDDLVVETERRTTRWLDHAPVRALPAHASGVRARPNPRRARRRQAADRFAGRGARSKA